MTGFSLSDIAAIMPLLVLCGGSLLLLLLDVFVPGNWRRGYFALLTLVVSVPYLIGTYPDAEYNKVIFQQMLYADPYTHFVTFLLIVSTILVVLATLKKLTSEGIEDHGEYYALMLMSTAGAIVFVSAAEMITLFLGLELMSMALYCLCGSARSKSKSMESALKYFLLGSFSSAFLLYGMALLYGLTGTTLLPELPQKLIDADTGVALMGLGLMVVGLVFKIGVVPFHFWAPDVYEGAPTPVTVYMATVIKIAAVATALRVMWTVFPAYSEQWTGFLWVMAVLTVVVANVVALRQHRLKRMLAFSSVGHAGYILMAFLAPGIPGAAQSILFYLVAYTFMTVGAFAVLLSLEPAEDGLANDDIRRLHGFGFSQPAVAALMALFMFSMAGIPPGMAGLLGKFYVISSVVNAGYVGLAIIAVLAAAVGCYYYLRVIVAMYFIQPPKVADDAAAGGIAVQGGTAAVAMDSATATIMIACALGVVLLGLFPGWLYEILSAVTVAL